MSCQSPRRTMSVSVPRTTLDMTAEQVNFNTYSKIIPNYPFIIRVHIKCHVIVTTALANQGAKLAAILPVHLLSLQCRINNIIARYSVSANCNIDLILLAMQGRMPGLSGVTIWASKTSIACPGTPSVTRYGIRVRPTY